jgi:hypothetical protein
MNITPPKPSGTDLEPPQKQAQKTRCRIASAFRRHNGFRFLRASRAPLDDWKLQNLHGPPQEGVYSFLRV